MRSGKNKLIISNSSIRITTAKQDVNHLSPPQQLLLGNEGVVVVVSYCIHFKKRSRKETRKYFSGFYSPRFTIFERN